MVTEQLIDYIKQQLLNGVNKEDIKMLLLTNGWNENDIIQTFVTLENQSTQINKQSSPSKWSEISNSIYYIVFVAILIIAGIAGGFSYLINKTSLLSGKIELNNKSISQWKRFEQIGDQECQEMGSKNSKIFISCKDHFYKSFDSGKSWQIDSFWDNLNSQPRDTLIYMKDFPYQIVFDNSGSTVYAASALSGIYRSKDGGVSWEPVNKGVRTKDSEKDGVGVSALVISPSNNNILYAVALDYTLIKTENMGDTWQILQDNTLAEGLSVNPNDPNQIYVNFAPTIKSMDGGKTLITGQDELPNPSIIKSHFIDPNNFQNILIGGFGGIFSSTNGGNNWELLAGPTQDKVLYQKWMVNFSVNPSNPNTIAVGTDIKGVLISQDRGKTWTEVNKGLVLEKENPKEFIIVENVRWGDDGLNLYLLTNHGVYILE